MTGQREQFGPNDWLVDEMYRQYRQDPASVSESWREFFSDYVPASDGRRGNGRGAPQEVSEPRASAGVVDLRREPAVAESPQAVALPEGAELLKGAAARIAANMDASLAVPTATSARVVPAKVLEENRRLINDALAAGRGGKVSFTHIVGFAILRALRTVPAMRSSYANVNGRPYVVRAEHVNLGLAVDVRRPDGTRTLLVPNIKRADTLGFAAFWNSYEDAIRRVRSNEVSPDDFAGTTVTLTNPGTIGTVLSVPRLMPGQGLIVGTGAIDYPAEFRGADPASLADLGVGKVMTVTSTYDHRVIQGAESGEFLDALSDLLVGDERFYDDIFSSLEIPFEPVRWSRDREPVAGTGVDKGARVLQLVNMYRVRGHLLADLNPLVHEARWHVELDPSTYGLGVWDLDRAFPCGGVGGAERATLRDILDVLRHSYCRTAAFEYMHIQEADQKAWIQERVERPRPELDHSAKRRLLDRLNAAEAFERFLHTKYVGHKRFGLEGAESLVPMLSTLLDLAAGDGIGQAVLGMAHRGRLNVLANIVGQGLDRIFREFEGDLDPDTTMGSGDVKYHLGARGTYTSPEGGRIEVLLASNPSHLEAVDPVVEGIARARRDLDGDDSVLPVLVHGDGAFAGQGVVAETFNLSQLPGYRTGGTVHIVVNNLIAYTTTPESSRSGVYATDVAKMVQAPIFHVNADDPAACVFVVDLAFAFRKAFGKDVVVDLVCYRRHGHSEADEPAYTQPLMYAAISSHRSVRKLYTEKLVNRGDLSVQEAEEALDDFRRRMEEAFEQTRAARPAPRIPLPRSHTLPDADTGVERSVLDEVASALSSWPDGFTPHPKLVTQLSRTAGALARDEVDWALAELLAIGTLLADGRLVRFAGQDSRRGTFSQRHAVLVDVETGREHNRLATLGRFEIYDSPLSEYAALGFEYGYAVGNRGALVVWEAQFGDFFNGAQIVVDEYVVASEDKWGQTCGLVMLLPHGYEGLGPDHSSARIERFLTLCAEDNIQVTFPTMPAQLFHLLRRQATLDPPRPLVVLTPKSLLRHPWARSAAADLEAGRFQPVLGDTSAPSSARRVLLCSGRVAADLFRRRAELGVTDVAIVRLEQLYPFPHAELGAALSPHPDAAVVWVQDEPENMGAWPFVFAKTARSLAGRLSLVARHESASPATGSSTVHQREEERVLEAAFA